MRSIRSALLATVAFAVSGCTSSSGIDALVPRPSGEVTSSIRQSEPTRPMAAVDTSDAEGGEVISLAEEQSREIDAAAPEAPLEAVAFVPPAKPQPALGAIQRHRFRDAKPIDFGKATSPRQLPVHGVDVSRWQGEIDWIKLRSQGANFVYIKATDGGDHLDPMFRKNWKAAADAGLKRGAYHFFYWCRGGADQADWFIRNVPKVKGALPPVIDVEWNGESRCKKRPSRKLVLAKMQAFMDKLEAHYGQRPVIYTAPDFYRDNLRGEFLDYPFWLRAVAQHPSKVYPGRKWVFWQYSGSGLSHGVKGKIDLNAFHGSEAEWRRWVAGNVYVAGR